MKFFQLRSRRIRPPAWVVEKTEEASIVEREANAVIAESRAHEWAAANTGLLKTICAGLRDLEVEPSSQDGLRLSGSDLG